MAHAIAGPGPNSMVYFEKQQFGDVFGEGWIELGKSGDSLKSAVPTDRILCLAG